MQKTIKCKHCGKIVPANPRLKGNQEYCNQKACQNARKRANKEQRKKADPEGFAKRQKKVIKSGVRTNPPIDTWTIIAKHIRITPKKTEFSKERGIKNVKNPTRKRRQKRL